VGLHFSCHGFINEEKTYRDDKDAFKHNKSKGDFLLFEEKNGISSNMYETQLK
jgi:hypothetical protein